LCNRLRSKPFRQPPAHTSGNKRFNDLCHLPFSIFHFPFSITVRSSGSVSAICHRRSFFEPPLRSFNASTLQRFNASTLQRFNASTLQRFNASTIQRFNNSTIQQQFNASTIQRFNDSTIQRFKRRCSFYKVPPNTGLSTGLSTLQACTELP
jgi:hypothetical protein